jgi:hypothetical protein
MGVFTRRPIAGGDIAAWAPFEEAQNEAGVGVMSGKLYNDAGVLKLPACLIGIDDGSNKGVAKFAAAETISLVGTSNSNWIKIELTVAGSATTLAAADIAGATDCTIIPASVKAAYNGLKGGFYLTATKRLIGLAWKNAAGTLLAIVNFTGSRWWASDIGGNLQNGPSEGFVINIGDWNMDTTATKSVTQTFGVFYAATKNIAAMIQPDTGVSPRLTLPISEFGGSIAGSVTYIITDPGGLGEFIQLTRVTGATFDSANYDLTPFNRGWIAISMRDF